MGRGGNRRISPLLAADPVEAAKILAPEAEEASPPEPPVSDPGIVAPEPAPVAPAPEAPSQAAPPALVTRDRRFRVLVERDVSMAGRRFRLRAGKVMAASGYGGADAILGLRSQGLEIEEVE